MKYTIIVGYTFSTDWLKKTREARADFEQTNIFPIFEKFKDTVSARFFDAEAFETEFSDFMILETEELQQYYFLMEALRDSPLIAHDLIDIKKIHIGIEDGYADYDGYLEKNN